MDELIEIQKVWAKRERVLARLGAMVAAGRLTEREAEQLRAARDPGTFGEVITDIRVRHAQAALDAAVEDDRMRPEEADGFLERMRHGEHPRSLRGHLASLKGSARHRDGGPHAASRSRLASDRPPEAV